MSTTPTTCYTGDKIDGIAVISQLNLDDLPPGRHRFMFQGARNGINQYWYVPIIVIKGVRPGKKLALQSAVHGDELNGIQLIQRLCAELDPQHLQGSVITAIGVNPSGMLAHSRYWQLMNDGGSLQDFNRVWPGKQQGNPAEQHAWLLYHRLWAGNTDYFIDLHTQSSGCAYPLFIFADYRHPEVQTLAELIPADQIKQDEGETGTVETAFIRAGIPAITLEIGCPKRYQSDLIERSLQGLRNIMIHYQLLPGTITQTAKEQHTYIGQQVTTIYAETGGFTDILVNLGDQISVGEPVARQRNAFGDILQEYLAPVNGKIHTIATDPLREPRSVLVKILS